MSNCRSIYSLRPEVPHLQSGCECLTSHKSVKEDQDHIRAFNRTEMALSAHVLYTALSLILGLCVCVCVVVVVVVVVFVVVVFVVVVFVCLFIVVVVFVLD